MFARSSQRSGSLVRKLSVCLCLMGMLTSQCCTSALQAVEAVGYNGQPGVRLLDGVAPGYNGIPQGTNPNAGRPAENLLAMQNGQPPAGQRYHAIWTVTVYAQNTQGVHSTGTYHVSSHTWDGGTWVPNQAAMGEFQAELASLPSRGWQPYNSSWQPYGVCMGS